MAARKTPTLPRVLALVFLAFLGSTQEGRGQETITSPLDCSGTFKVHSTQLTLLIQQRVTSQADVYNCEYVFEAPEGVGLLVFVNGITAVDDGEIPGCPVKIYDADDKLVEPLCGHYQTTIIPVSSSKATVAYRPEYQGSPYTLTLDLQVTRSDDDTSVLCADAELRAVPSVPVRYGVVLRDDGSANGAQQVCDYKVVSNSVNETLRTGCLVADNGSCTYEVLLSNGSQLGRAEDPISLAEVGGGVTVRLRPGNASGILTLTLPEDFEPVDSLDRPVNGTDVLTTTTTQASGGSDFNVTDDGQDMSTTPAQGTPDDGSHDHGHHDCEHGHGHRDGGSHHHGHHDCERDHGHGDGGRHHHDHDDDDDRKHHGHDDDDEESYWDITITWMWRLEFTMVFARYGVEYWFWSWF